MRQNDNSIHVKSFLCQKAIGTILLIEGVGASLKGWDDLYGYFIKNNYNVIMYDHPCSGRSLVRSKNKKIGCEHFESAFENVVNSISAPVHVVGYSLGGFLAFRKLAESSIKKEKLANKIKSLVVAGGFSKMSKKLRDGLSLTRNQHERLGSRECYLNSLPYLYDKKTLQNKNKKEFLEKRCLSDPEFISSSNFIQQLDVCIQTKKWSSEPRKTNIKVPVLLMFAKDDVVVSPDETLNLKAYFRDVEVVRFSRGGHCFKDVHTRRFCNEVLKFVSKNN